MFSHTGNQPLLHPGLTICVRSQKGEEGIGLANLVLQHDIYSMHFMHLRKTATRVYF